ADGVGGDLFIDVGLDDAGQGDVAVVDHDADGVGGVVGVLGHGGVAVDGAGGLEADLVVHHGGGSDFDVVHDAFDALGVGDDVEGGVTVGVVAHLTTHDGDAVFDVQS